MPYKGNGDALGNLIGGHVSMMFLSIQPIIGNVKAGTLRALAVTTAERSPLMPDVPPIAESAVPGFSAAIRYGLVGAARHAAPDHRAAEQGASRRAVVRRACAPTLAREGAAPMPSTPEEYAAAIDAEETKWAADRQKPQPEIRVAQCFV